MKKGGTDTYLDPRYDKKEPEREEEVEKDEEKADLPEKVDEDEASDHTLLIMFVLCLLLLSGAGIIYCLKKKKDNSNPFFSTAGERLSSEVAPTGLKKSI